MECSFNKRDCRSRKLVTVDAGVFLQGVAAHPGAPKLLPNTLVSLTCLHFVLNAATQVQHQWRRSVIVVLQI